MEKYEKPSLEVINLTVEMSMLRSSGIPYDDDEDYDDYDGSWT